MKLLSSFTHPYIVPRLYGWPSSVEHKRQYFEKCFSVFFFKSIQWKSIGTKTAWFQTFFKISYFVFHRRKKCIPGWPNMRVSKWWQNCPFWVNYPIKASSHWTYLTGQDFILFPFSKQPCPYHNSTNMGQQNKHTNTSYSGSYSSVILLAHVTFLGEQILKGE